MTPGPPLLPEAGPAGGYAHAQVITDECTDPSYG